MVSEGIPITLSPPSVSRLNCSVALYFSGSRAFTVARLSALSGFVLALVLLEFELAIDAFVLEFAFVLAFEFVFAGWQLLTDNSSERPSAATAGEIKNEPCILCMTKPL
jgi:hypothetical protein